MDMWITYSAHRRKSLAQEEYLTTNNDQRSATGHR